MGINLNKVTLIGHVGSNPETRGKDESIVKFTMATSESWTDRDSGDRQERTQWHTVVIYAPPTARFVKQYVSKGDLVCVEGQIEYRKWEREDGTTLPITEIIIRPFNGSVQAISKDKSSGGNPRSGGETTSASSSRMKEPARLREKLDDDIPF